MKKNLTKVLGVILMLPLTVILGFILFQSEVVVFLTVLFAIVMGFVAGVKLLVNGSLNE